MPLPLTLQQLSPLFCFHDPGLTFVLSMQGLQQRGYNRFNAIFSGRTAVRCFLCLAAFTMWLDGKRPQGLWCKRTRLLRRICCGGVRQHHLGVKKTASIVSTISRLHQVQFQFSHVFIFQLGQNFAVAVFILMSLDSKSLHFTSFAFRLVLTFCDLALLLRPSLLYQRSVKRRQRMLHRLRRCLSLSGKPK